VNAYLISSDHANARAEALQTEARNEALARAARAGRNPLQMILDAVRPQRKASPTGFRVNRA
jgi:predicted AAA+ superfamily ATPase